MRIAILGDLHLIAPEEPLADMRAQRRHFAEAWPSAKSMLQKLRKAAPDLVVSLGDLVDWYSEANRDFVLELMAELNLPWVVTPGNHDFEMVLTGPDGAATGLTAAWDTEAVATAGWNAAGIELGHRVIDAGEVGLVLLNSACSTVAEGTREWLEQTLTRHPRNLLFTHTPLDIPEARDFILSIEPDRDLKKYVQSGAPWVYEACLRDRIEQAFFGHLHFAGERCVNGATMYFRGLSVAAVGVTYRRMGEAMMLDVAGGKTDLITL